MGSASFSKRKILSCVLQVMTIIFASHTIHSWNQPLLCAVTLQSSPPLLLWELP